MKHIYFLLGTLLFSGLTTAQQGSISPVPHNVNVRSAALNSAVHIPINKPKSILYANDFSVAGDWTINNDAGNNDDWVIGTGVPSGSFPIVGIQSTTAGNGFGLFDSDLLCSGSQDANLQITNSIDLSAAGNVVFEFEQYYRKYQGFTYLEISTDGSTWTQFEVNAGYAINDASATNPELVSVNISSATQSSSTVWFRFKYVGGCDYAWMVDDITISDAADDDLELTNVDFTSSVMDPYSGNYVTYHNYPVNQITPIHFSSRVCNVGSLGQTMVQGTYDVPSDGYAGSSIAMSPLNPAACDTLHDSNDWTPGSAIATHTIDFGIDYDNSATEDTPENNVDSASVSVSQYTYERYPNNWAGAELWNGDDGAGNTTAFEMGNTYQIFADDTISAINAVISSNTTVGTIVYAVLYSVDLTTGDFIYTDQSNDITLTATDLASTGVDPHRVIFELPNQPVVAGESWLAVVGHYGGPDQLLLGNGNGATPEQTAFLLDGSDNTWYFLGSNPMVGLEMLNTTSTANINEELQGGLKMENSPNPFNEFTIVNYEIPAAGDVTLKVFDLTGKQIVELNEGHKTAGAYSIQVNGNGLAAGSYFYTLSVGSKQITKRMIITK
ncbi:MAG: T9SS type A sorting domain-containing protein [Crocinitomicaceae bacterium]|nr:T9SS type A sorting domain-containing protein [Crocinitomicaceae bacterium]